MPVPLISTHSPQLLSTVESWFGDRSEVLMLVRFACAGGNRDFEFVQSFEGFHCRLSELKPKTSVTVFKEPQLSLRGIVDDSFIEMCLASVPDGTEYVVAETKQRVAGSQAWFHNDSGTSHRELRESLEDSRGVFVVVGQYPPWLETSESILTAYVPDPDGVVRPGAY